MRTALLRSRGCVAYRLEEESPGVFVDVSLTTPHWNEEDLRKAAALYGMDVEIVDGEYMPWRMGTTSLPDESAG